MSGRYTAGADQDQLPAIPTDAAPTAGLDLTAAPDSPQPAQLDAIRELAIFRQFDKADWDIIAARLVRLNFKHGEELIHDGDPSDAIFIVLSGRFLVYRQGSRDPIDEITPGELVGEIGFFSNAPRNATVVAARDSAVAVLGRSAFNDIVGTYPRIYDALLRALALRLADLSARVPPSERRKAARTVAVVPGGSNPLPAAFAGELRRIFGRRGRSFILDEREVAHRFPGASLDGPIVSDWLNQCEYEHDLVVYLGHGADDAWTQKAIRQADQILIVVSGAPPQELNAAETEVGRSHDVSNRRLVILHETRPRTPAGTTASGTRHWLANRPVFQHHHVALDNDSDFERLHRFLTGRATGFIAAGGGGYGPAHVGIYKAFIERGLTFDMVGGTSVGASLSAGFAMLRTPERIDDDTRAIFIAARAFKRRTWPRYSLLDHTAFDEALRQGSCGVEIEDMWLPYFAVATDLSANQPYIFRTGPLWKAMRASGSVPGALPPMFSTDGHMLVDGGLVDNIPLRPMRALKGGPNVVVHFGLPRVEPFTVDYDAIPGRWPLIRQMLFSRKKLPPVPGPVNVLRRSLFANKTFDTSWVGPHDLVLAPPPFPGSSFLDFDRHTDVFNAAYHWAIERIDQLTAEEDPAFAALRQASA